MVKFITNHHRSQALFRGKSALDLLKPGDMRLATNFIMLDCMLEVREALQKLVVGREWREWNGKSNHSDDGDEVKEHVLRSGFWKNLEEVLALTKGMVALCGSAIEGWHLGVLSWDQSLCSEVCTGACNLGKVLGDAAQRHACRWVCS